MIEIQYSKKELVSEIRTFGNCNIDISEDSIDDILVKEASEKSQERLNYHELYGIDFDTNAFDQHKIDYFTILLEFLKRINNQRGIRILQAYLDKEQEIIDYHTFLECISSLRDLAKG